jgi:hypothetical protein
MATTSQYRAIIRCRGYVSARGRATGRRALVAAASPLQICNAHGFHNESRQRRSAMATRWLVWFEAVVSRHRPRAPWTGSMRWSTRARRTPAPARSRSLDAPPPPSRLAQRARHEQVAPAPSTGAVASHGGARSRARPSPALLPELGPDRPAGEAYAPDDPLAPLRPTGAGGGSVWGRARGFEREIVAFSRLTLVSPQENSQKA